MRLPPFPFPPPPEDAGPVADAETRVSRGDSALVAAAIAAPWALISLGQLNGSRGEILGVAMWSLPIPIVAILGALLGPSVWRCGSVVGPTVVMAFASLYATFAGVLVAIWFAMGRTHDATVAVFAMALFGGVFALFGLIVTLPSAVAWALLTRELFGTTGSMRRLAPRARRICAVVVAAAVLGSTYVALTRPWTWLDGVGRF
jgi:hypothetical protein